MEVDRPGPGEELNPGAPTPPRPAAAVILLRRGPKHREHGLEVLLGRRKHEPRQGYWDLPGGFLEEGEEPLEGLRRELREGLFGATGIEA